MTAATDPDVFHMEDMPAIIGESGDGRASLKVARGSGMTGEHHTELMERLGLMAGDRLRRELLSMVAPLCVGGPELLDAIMRTADRLALATTYEHNMVCKCAEEGNEAAVELYTYWYPPQPDDGWDGNHPAFRFPPAGLDGIAPPPAPIGLDRKPESEDVESAPDLAPGGKEPNYDDTGEDRS
jgi:hypothetical protein